MTRWKRADGASLRTLPGLPAGTAAVCARCFLRALRGPDGDAIHALKYDRLHPAARGLGKCWPQAIAQLAARSAGGDAGGSGAAAPVKHAQRGFNQARSLAAQALRFPAQVPSGVAAYAGLKHADAAARHREPGRTTPRERRHECARGVLGFRSGGGDSEAHLLIDDILTPAQRRAPPRRRSRAGAATVWVATLARARRVNGLRRELHSGQERRTTTEAMTGTVFTGMQACIGIHHVPRPTIFLTRGKEMSLGKAMIHARKQKSIAKAAAMAADHGSTVQPHHMLQMPVLVLNASYEPINICGARRALVLVLKGIARTEEEHGLMLHAQRSRIAMPSVIRLLEYRRIPHQTRALSRKNILLRDRNSCQYCGDGASPRRTDAGSRDSPLPRRQLNLGKPGGVLPRLQPPQGQPHAPRDRRHDPAARPRPFSLHTSRQIMRMLGRGDDRWRKYLFY